MGLPAMKPRLFVARAGLVALASTFFAASAACIFDQGGEYKGGGRQTTTATATTATDTATVPTPPNPPPNPPPPPPPPPADAGGG
ncbi:MAG TPA: hypothetical protein VIF62_01315 [Labilithrix sp.]